MELSLQTKTQMLPAGGLRILIVEDHKDTAESMAVVLRGYGHTVDTVSDGPSAIACAEASPRPNVILLDIGLPGMDGYEVAKTLRKQEKQRCLLIAVTGYGLTIDERLLSYESGIDLHLTKPVSAVELEGYLDRYQTVSRRSSG